MMKNQAIQRPTAMGSLLQASTYGATIPTVYGMTQSPLLAIWAANLRQGGSIKKFKQLKKGITAYVENIDFLLGHNPIRGVGQVMNNGGNMPLTFTSTAFSPGINPHIVISDPHFYAVIAVTLTVNYSFAINDYGGQGPQTLSGSYEIPFWNELENGPDPTSPSGIRNYPCCYRWAPSYGNNVYIDTIGLGLPLDIIGFYLNVYYSQLMPATSYQAPITRLRLAFEPELGSGTEYSDAGLSAQQIIYPQFAGLGSSNIDLGSSGALPQLLPEVMGKWGIYPSGDADFTDMIEDVVKSGLAQASLDASTIPYTQMERGLSCYDLPGTVQAKTLGSIYVLGSLGFTLPTTAGNFLIVAAGSGSTGTLAISDTGGNSWTALLPPGLAMQVWWAQAVGGNTVVSITGFPGNNTQISLFEIAGIDTFDTSAIGIVTGSGGTAIRTATVTTSNIQNTPSYLLGIGIGDTGMGLSGTSNLFWNKVLNSNISHYFTVAERTVYTPGTYSLAMLGSAVADSMVLFCFKAVQPVAYPRPLGDFIDYPSLEVVRDQCRAYGLWGSLSMNSQSSASEWLKTLYQAANAAPVYLGDKLYSYPYSEVSAAGNGAQFTALTASGPIANLSDLNGDFIDNGCPNLKTIDRIGLPNVLQMQCISRNSQYNQVTVQQTDSGSLALYGQRKAAPIVNNAIQDASVARALLGVQVRKNQYGGDKWTFTVTSRWCLLSPMDLITITDTLQNIAAVPVRITSITESGSGFAVEAEPFIYGMYAPTALAATSPTLNANSIGTDAGNVNAPVIIEPTARLAGLTTQAQLWLAISSAALNYGGCQVYISTDGGASYNPIGDPIVGSAVTGASTADWPASTDPDTTNDLLLDLTECNGSLLSYAAADRDSFLYPCYMEGGGTYPILYELMTYNLAVLTSAFNYTLKATGAGNELRRGVYSAPSPGIGVDHPLGSRFAFLSPTGQGILKLPMDGAWIGQTLHFKICSFNNFGGAAQTLTTSGIVDYTYTPNGAAAATGGGSIFQVNGA